MRDVTGKSVEQIRTINNKVVSGQILEILEVIVQDQMIFNSFIREMEVMDVNETSVVFGFASINALELVKRDYSHEVARAIEDALQKPLTPKFILKGEYNLFEVNKTVTSQHLLKRLSFENYVTAEFNKEAVSIAKKIVTNLGTFSPFFVTSKSGLGKTHLLHAIGNELTKNDYSVIYIDPHAFTREITEKSQLGGTNLSNYIANLKQFDVLIFDDIQNLGDRVVSLKVLFDLVNSHIDNGKQIIIASDKLAKELSGFESRFITRFNSGLTSIIKEPSIDDLVKVLEKKLTWNGMDIKKWENEALRFIARNNSSSIRSIEGAVKRVIFFIGTDSNIQYTAKVVSNIFKELSIDPGELTPQRILQVVANYYKINIKDITGQSRKKEFVVPRHMSIYLIKKICTGVSLVEIGKIFGGRDHTTIIASVRKIDTEIKIDQAVKLAAEKIEQNIKSIS